MNYVQFSAIFYFLSIALCFWLYFEWKKYRIDRLRFDLFRMRDYLFHQAANEKIAFDSEAYILVRSSINGMIRFSHEISFLNLYLYKKSSRKDSFKVRSDAYRTRLEEAFSQLEPQQVKVMQGVMQAIHFRLMKHVSFNSFPAIFVTAFMFFWFVLDTIYRKINGSNERIIMQESQPFDKLTRRIEILEGEILDGCTA